MPAPAVSLSYLGGFGFPDTNPGALNSFNYANGSSCYNPANNSLFVVGHVSGNLVSEMSIPPLDGSLPQTIQPFAECSEGIISAYQASIPNSQGVRLGGLMIHDGKLLVTMYEFFGGAPWANQTHFVRNSLNLSATGQANGPYAVNGTFPVPYHAGMYAGYMTKVPTAWQSRLNATHVMGNGLLSIMARTSEGPSLHGFNPDNPSAPTQPLIAYDPDTTLGVPPMGGWSTTVLIGDVLNSVNGTGRMMGAVMEGDYTLIFGLQAPGRFYYGDGHMDPEVTWPAPWNGPWHPWGDYRIAVWIYRNSDIEKVVQGITPIRSLVAAECRSLSGEANSIIPHGVYPPPGGQFNHALFDGIKSASYDPATKRIYITGWNQYSWLSCYVLQLAIEEAVQITEDMVRTPGWTEFPGQGRSSNVWYVAGGSGSEVATFTVNITPGQYRLSATWSEHANRATDSPFRVYDGPGGSLLATVRKNQQLAPASFTSEGSAWEDLGTFTFPGAQLVIDLGNDANGFVIADAIRVERVT